MPIATPAELAQPRRHFLVEIWQENREIFKVLIGDAFLFQTALALLFVGFLGLRGMEWAGFPHERILSVETVHYWGYHIVFVIFIADLIGKLLWFLLLKRKV